MTHKADRILTTHVGSLIRPAKLIEFWRSIEDSEPYDEAAFEACLTESVAEVVRQQAEIGSASSAASPLYFTGLVQTTGTIGRIAPPSGATGRIERAAPCSEAEPGTGERPNCRGALVQYLLEHRFVTAWYNACNRVTAVK
ncbi:MAG: hypothetical protein WAK55_05435 [Xanthobacteraceae bacterium]